MFKEKGDDMNTNTATIETTCNRCAGYKTFTAFAHVAGGTCFDCGGTGLVSGAVLARQAAKVDRYNREVAKEQTRFAAFRMSAPYTVSYDGIETVGSHFRTWADAKEHAAELEAFHGGRYRVCKWDGQAYRYRDGSTVVFGN